MTSLSPKARALLDLAQRAPQHSPGAAARVRQGIEAQLLVAPAPATAAAGSTVLTKALIGGVLVAAIGAAIFELAETPAPMPTAAPTAPSPTRPEPTFNDAPSAIAPIVEAPPPALPTPSRARSKTRPTATPPTPVARVVEPRISGVDALEAERALVIAAREHVRRGAHSKALATLAEAETLFAAGAFFEERQLLLARAHCALGDTDAALAVIRALPEGSAYRAPANAACHFETDSEPAGHSGDR